MRRLMCRAVVSIAVLAVAGGASPATAQDQTRVVGRVVDQARRPIPGVEVIIDRQDHRASTDSAGVFSVPVSRTDTTIAFRRIGYRPVLVTLAPLPRPGDTVLVQLAASPLELPELIVSAPPSKPLRYAGTTKYDDVFHRRRLGLGNILTRDELDRKTAILTPEFLQGLPGIRVSLGLPGSGTTAIRFARCTDNSVAVFIDGARLIPQANPREQPVVEMLTRISPTEIEMIEVYRGASQIPGIYHWDGCAVVALWTRWN